jgi:hypothetical protein
MNARDEMHADDPDAPEMPPRGEAAFVGDSAGSHEASLSRAAQLLCMTLFAVGTPEQRADIETDAALLGVPLVRKLFADDGRISQYEVDSLTKNNLATYGPDRSSAWERNMPATREQLQYLWRAAEFERRPDTALAMVNLSLNSPDEIERVSSAAAINAVTRGRSPKAEEILQNATRSPTNLVADLASTALGKPSPGLMADALGDQAYAAVRSDRPHTVEPSNSQPNERHVQASVAIHGTWARLDHEDTWYVPSSTLSNHIRARVNPDLYARRNYFRWPGGYGRDDWRQGSTDFHVWKSRAGVDQIDTVYAHSHGGNVALNILAEGQRASLLVLMHTPASTRTDEQWRRIRENTGRVLVLRTRGDLVMLADALTTGSRLSFDQEKLPHRQVLPHLLAAEGWFSHDLFVSYDTWTKFRIADEVRYEHGLIRNHFNW